MCDLSNPLTMVFRIFSTELIFGMVKSTWPFLFGGATQKGKDLGVWGGCGEIFGFVWVRGYGMC